jgi:hypothetical protein
MEGFFRERGLWLAAVVLIMFAISLAQGGISYTMAAPSTFSPAPRVIWGSLAEVVPLNSEEVRYLCHACGVAMSGTRWKKLL